MISLYVSVFSFLTLFFEYIDKTYPDALNYYVDPYSTGMRFSIASLIVLFPLFILLMRFIRRDMDRDATRRDIWVRRWMLYLTIFIAGATVAGDLISLVNTFLGGEITMRFIMKVIVVLLVASIGLMHFMADIWGYWIQNPHYARRVGWGVTSLVVITIASGFIIMGTPGQIRLYRFDEEKVRDLESIQYQIVNFWQAKQKLPSNLEELIDPLNPNPMPRDSQTGAAYIYRHTATTTFVLCATFNAETDDSSLSSSGMAAPRAPFINDGLNVVTDTSWYHAAGEACFLRVIDPERYPSLNKKVVPDTVPVKVPASTK